MKDFSTLKLISAKKGIKRIILNDPKSYNSLSLKTINDLIYLFKKLENDNDCKVIIWLPIYGENNG